MTDIAAKIDRISERLARHLGMLGSEHPGERAAAALKADDLLKREGLKWRDVLQSRDPLDVDSESESETDWRTMARECVARAGVLSDREISFVRSMMRWRGQPTERQLNWLLSIHSRMGGCR